MKYPVLKASILEKASSLYNRYGIRNVTMDDVAKELGISKKTIYQHFKDKDALVNQFVTQQIDQELEDIEAIEASSNDAIETVLKMSDYFKENAAKNNPSVMYDIEKYYPQAREILSHYHDTKVKKIMQRNLIKGIKNGLYRPDIDIELVPKFWQHLMDWTCDIDSFPPQKYDLWEIHLQLMDYVMRSLVTLKGFQRLEEHRDHFKYHKKPKIS